MSVPRKLILIYLLDLLVTAFIMIGFIGEKIDRIDFSRKEVHGEAAIAATREVYTALLDTYREPAATRLSTTGLDEALRDGTATVARLPREVGALEPWQQVEQAIRALGQADPTERAAAMRAARAALAEFVAEVGDRSNLILDPDLDSYYAMVITVVHMTTALELTMDLADAALVPPADAAADDRRARLLVLEGALRRVQSEVDRAIRAGLAGNPDGSLRATLAPAGATFDAAVNRLVLAVRADLDGAADRDTAVVAALRSDRDGALVATLDLWTVAGSELNRLLEARIRGFYADTGIKLALAAVLVLAVLAMVNYVAGQIAAPVRALVRVAETVGDDKPHRADWRSGDEFGRLVTAFNGMLDRLAEENARRTQAVAEAKAAAAQRDLLEAIPLPITVTALADGAVLHANHAARVLFGAGDGRALAGFAFLPQQDRTRVLDALANDGEIDEQEVDCTDVHGKPWSMLLSARSIAYRDTPAVLTTLTPVNELKQAQADLRAAKDEAEVTARRLRSITDTVMSSIDYASRIQRTIFPDPALLEALDHDLGIWVEQRDIVGGDWYWVERFEGGDLVFLCDCTGHGVPGALMTMLVSACFKRVVTDYSYNNPALILQVLHRLVRSILDQGGRAESDDGLDAVCLFFDRTRRVVRLASARMPVLLHKDGRLVEIKGDRTSLGYPSLPEELNFTLHTLPAAPGDTFYLFTDGVTDQVGGPNRLMFGRRRLLAALEAIADLPARDQIGRLQAALADYRRAEPTRDDLSLLVLRIADTSAGAKGGATGGAGQPLSEPVDTAA